MPGDQRQEGQGQPGLQEELGVLSNLTCQDREGQERCKTERSLKSRAKRRLMEVIKMFCTEVSNDIILH